MFCVAYKNVTTKLRAGLRIMHYLGLHTRPERGRRRELIDSEKDRLLDEYIRVCKEVLDFVEDKLLPSCEDSESQVFYLKM